MVVVDGDEVEISALYKILSIVCDMSDRDLTVSGQCSLTISAHIVTKV